MLWVNRAQDSLLQLAHGGFLHMAREINLLDISTYTRAMKKQEINNMLSPETWNQILL
jgi:hypothetical protein